MGFLGAGLVGLVAAGGCLVMFVGVVFCLLYYGVCVWFVCDCLFAVAFFWCVALVWWLFMVIIWIVCWGLTLLLACGGYCGLVCLLGFWMHLVVVCFCGGW